MYDGIAFHLGHRDEVDRYLETQREGNEAKRAAAGAAELLGVVLLLAPVPARLKEWAYAGFAIDLGSALIAHLSVGALVLLLAPRAGHAGEHLTAR